MPAMPIADSSAPMVVGMRQTSSATSTTTETEPPPKLAKGTSVTTTGKKTMVSTASRIVRAISFGRLLTIGALDQRDHAVNEGLASFGRDAHHDAVRQDLGAARHRRTVTAGFADDRRRLARDGRLVHRGNALDDLAVGGNDVAGLADHQVTLGEIRRRDQLFSAVGRRRRASVSERILRRVSAWALPRPSAMASAKLAKITVKNSQIVMDQVNVLGWAHASKNVITEPTSTTNMTGFFTGLAGRAC